MKKQHIISLFCVIGALTISGCNLLASMSAEVTQRVEINKICKEAELNKARANEIYKNKLIKPLSGNFNLSDIVGGYSASIRFETANYEVSYDIGTEGDKWKQYNQGQYVTSEERVLTHVNTSDNITNKHYCYIGTAPAPKK